VKPPIFIVWLLLTSATAVVVGALCATFTHGLVLVTGWQNSIAFSPLLLPLILFATLKIFAWVENVSSEEMPSSWLRSCLQRENLSDLLLLPFTWLSHLGGASVGRESVAVAVGRAVASVLAVPILPKTFSAAPETLARIGTACGFAAMFGTPWTAIIFAFEWRGEIAEKSSSGWLKSLRDTPMANFFLTAFGSFFAFAVVHRLFRVEHPEYSLPSFHFDTKWLLFIVAMFFLGVFLSAFYTSSKRVFGHLMAKFQDTFWLRVLLPSIVVAAVISFGWGDSMKGLGLGLIELSFGKTAEQPVLVWTPFAKAALTAFCVAAGFKGGEVTPLLAVGSSAGFVMGEAFGIQSELAAAVGYPIMFSMIFNAPLTGLLLSSELFGVEFWTTAAVMTALILVKNYLGSLRLNS
jgi:H+/Cl- antiporter ClcA